MVISSMYPEQQKHLIDMSLNIWYLTVFGLVPLDKTVAWKCFLHTAYCAVILAIYVIIVAGIICGMVRDWGDFDAIINNFISIVGIVSTFAKYTYLLYKSSDVTRLLKMLWEFENHQWPGSLLSEWSDIITKTSRHQCTITVAFTIYMLIIFVLWAMSPIITTTFSGTDPSGRRSHPYITEYFIDHQTSPNYEFVYCFEALGLFIFCMVAVIFDTLCVAFFIQAGGQFKIMLAALRKLQEMIEESMCDGKTYTNVEDAIIVKFGTSFPTGSKNYQQEAVKSHLNKYLSSCIKHHNDIIKFVKNVDDVFNPIILVQIMYSVCEIAITGLQSTEKSVEFGDLVKFAMFTTSLTFEVYLFCKYADNVLNLSQEVATVAYSCEWYDMDPHIKAMLQMIMMRAQREVKLTAYRFKVLSMDTYGSLLNGAYTYFALLKEVKKGNAA